MKQKIRCIELGLTNLRGYGSHPGTPWLVFFVAVGTLVGGWRGGLLQLAVFGSLYLAGAYGRGAAYLRSRDAVSPSDRRP